MPYGFEPEEQKRDNTHDEAFQKASRIAHPRLERVCLDEFDKNVERDNVLSRGECTVSVDQWNGNVLKLETPGETRMFRTAVDFTTAKPSEFLEMVDRYLKFDDYYLWDVAYTPAYGKTNYRLKGMLYKNWEGRR